jgi:hypothetical protein
MAVSDISSCCITYDHHSDNSGGVIYNPYIFVILAPGHNVKKYGHNLRIIVKSKSVCPWQACPA